jgi:hypothetical protein
MTVWRCRNCAIQREQDGMPNTDGCQNDKQGKHDWHVIRANESDDRMREINAAAIGLATFYKR